MYMNTLLHCHFCIQIITDHFLLSKVSLPIHTIPGINAHLLYPILYPWKYSIRHKLLYCPVCIFGCFHGNQRCVASCHYFYTWRVLQEMDIISTVRPYVGNDIARDAHCNITMGNDVARDMHCHVTMSNDVVICYVYITMHNDVASFRII